jgi:hypothetical protein
MKLERKPENFAKKTLMNLELGSVFLITLESEPCLVYWDKDCETRYLNLKTLEDVELSPSTIVFLCDSSLSYCVRSSLNGN